MATKPLPRPTLWQRTKKLVDRTLGTVGGTLSKPPQAEELEVAPAPVAARQPLPANADMVPPVFLEGFAEIFAEIRPNFRQVVYRLRDARVAWHGTALKGLRVFLPSLPQPRMEMEFAGTFLLRQLKSRAIPLLQTNPVGLAFDSWSGNYFHWIAEVLPRLALLRRVQPNCVLLLPGPRPPEYITRTVSALGFTRTHVVSPGELVTVPDLWVAARPGRHGYMVPELVREVREAIMASLAPHLDPARRATRRLYVSRSRQGWRQLTNEAQVVAVLERYGFETIYFEDMSFVEQVRTMYEAAIFIGIHGANMTNILFMTPGSHAIEMMSNTYVNPSYLAMADSIGVSYSLVPSTLGSPLEVEHNYADITADPALVEQVIRPLCTDR
ncbi:glycosyltransferase family 61 protein [Hymenobacter lapidiphilus]|uniref:Glycosyltransferase family 61 protein n=1 Tax=Hymenobacter lapidiphilus TaxID=2608003 RepID=A0A7Y7PQD0_9BACT|nr:glycosyltransferase family 61 protein [Hymenobacter lapidiphilus]NVO32124.1 glycosyltransferase family 61 protein [Hymenobacter lapidiphilus]